MVSTHGLTNDSMVLLDAMDVQDGRIVHGEEEQLSQQQHFEIWENGARPFHIWDRLARWLRWL